MSDKPSACSRGGCAATQRTSQRAAALGRKRYSDFDYDPEPGERSPSPASGARASASRPGTEDRRFGARRALEAGMAPRGAALQCLHGCARPCAGFARSCWRGCSEQSGCGSRSWSLHPRQQLGAFPTIEAQLRRPARSIHPLI